MYESKEALSVAEIKGLQKGDEEVVTQVIAEEGRQVK